MCVYSMIVDHFGDKWTTPPYTIPAGPTIPWRPEPVVPPVTVPFPPVPPHIPERPAAQPYKPLTPDEIEDLRKLLERATEYDKRTGQADCETEAKIERLKNIIKKLAPETDLSFLDGEKKSDE